ncbi:MAG: hypothetical protein KJO79_02065 [Verrucomicrobiae bacterium]|nr:hypothetical protein [Verrucomicrobiae bacterium]NNJ85938.1 hypothetical protein [Akkermansiaceae bacterium]
MKPTLKYAAIGLAVCAGLVSLTAEPSKSPTQKTPASNAATDPFKAPPNIRVQLEYIEMPLLTMAELMDDEKAAASDVALRARVAELIKNGKAKLIDIQMLTTPDGTKASSESIREFIYPTEYEPSELPNEIHLLGNGKKATIPSHEYATGPTPTAFETRNLGTSFECEATIDPATPYIHVRFAPETVSFVEYITYADWKGQHGRADIVMPIIYSMKVTGSLYVADSKPVLVSSLSPKNEKGVTDLSRKLLVFLKADILPVK